MSTSEGQDLSDDKGSEESEAEDGEEDPLDQDDESCEQMNELQLKIKLEQTRNKNLKMECELAKTRDKSKQETGAGDAMHKNLKGLLPSMDDQSPVEFFCVFEKTMQLNDVAKMQWAKYLPGTLTSRASQIYSEVISRGMQKL